MADFLVRRGAHHHIFSAIALNLAGEVRRIVAADSSALNRRQSRNENHRTPLHFVVLMDRPEMVAQLLDLGPIRWQWTARATTPAYARSSETDRPVMEKLRAMMAAELVSAGRGQRTPRGGPMDLVALLALGDWETATRLVRENPGIVEASEERST